MKFLVENATKVVFIMLIKVASFAFLWSVFTGKTVMDTKDFMVLASAATAFYFSYKGSDKKPYAGK